MKDSLHLLKELLAGRNWEAVTLASDHLLADSDLTASQRAFCYYAKCRALSNLGRYGVALEPGQRATYLAENVADADLLGLTLIEVAWIQHNLKLYREAASSLQRFIDRIDQLSPDVAGHHASVLINLGTNLRALGQHEEALGHFTTAWKTAKSTSRAEANNGNPAALAEIARSSAVWEAFEIGQFDVARKLMTEGETYLRTHPEDRAARAAHLVDQARLASSCGDHASAYGYAGKALSLAEKEPDLLANIFLVLYDVDSKRGFFDDAYTAAVTGIKWAELAERYDLCAAFRERLEQLLFAHPEIVEAATADTLRTARRRSDP